jgi:dolichol kinase
MNLVLLTGILFCWNLFVIHYLSKKGYEFAKVFPGVPAEYVGRKIVHIFGAGITAFTVPYYYVGYEWVVAVSAFFLAIYIYAWRHRALLFWFQVPDNRYEVHFALAYGSILLIGTVLGNIWIGLIPMLFMSFGDSATGLVRAFNQRRRVKSWDGTAAMFLVCLVISGPIFGWYGIILSAVASLVEKIPEIDDNITVPIVTAGLVYLHSSL